MGLGLCTLHWSAYRFLKILFNSIFLPFRSSFFSYKCLKCCFMGGIIWLTLWLRVIFKILTFLLSRWQYYECPTQNSLVKVHSFIAIPLTKVYSYIFQSWNYRTMIIHHLINPSFINSLIHYSVIHVNDHSSFNQPFPHSLIHLFNHSLIHVNNYL